ncbi:MAG: type IV pilus secretin PilQ [Bdellovibrionales bacterium]
MRLLWIVLLAISVSIHTSCQTAPARNSNVADVDDEFDIDLNENGSANSSNGSSEDLDLGDDSGNQSMAQMPPDEELGAIEDTPAPQEDAPVPEMTPAPSIAEEVPVPTTSEQEVEVTALDFKSREGGGTIVIQTTEPTTYTTRINPENQQFIVEVNNAKLPAKFKRPYNTKEFSGPIAGIQAYQNAGSKTARFVIQLKESIEPVVRQVGNSISIAPSEESLSLAEVDGAVIEQGEKTPDSPLSALSSRNIDEFLLNQSKFYGRKISIQFKDADIRDVFNFISEESGLNIIVGEEVIGKITLKLRQIPWDQALIVILKAKKLGYVRQGNILRIASLKTIQDEADAAKGVMDAQAKLRPLRVKVFPVSYAKVIELEAQSKEFLSERGKAKADTRTNSLIVNDLEENIERIGRLIDILDTQTPQVLIEARVVEARQTFQRILGINWSMKNGSLPVGQMNGTPISLRPELNMQSGSAQTINARLGLGSFDLLGDIEATLSLFETEGLVRVISSPRIVTLNGVKANIEQTSEVPFKKTDSLPGGAQTTTTLFKPIQLKLEVTPQITAEGGVVMTVKVIREFPGQDVSGQGDVPINRRIADTTVLVQNGQTTVMGGIFQSDVTEGETGVPFLRKVPILGGLFRSRTYNKDKNELLIFLTPRILNKDKAFRQAKGE